MPRGQLDSWALGRDLAATGPAEAMTDEGEIEPREAARTRRRDRDAEAEQRALLRPGMGKVFKQIQDAQRRAADAADEQLAGQAPKPAKRRRR